MATPTLAKPASKIVSKPIPKPTPKPVIVKKPVVATPLRKPTPVPVKTAVLKPIANKPGAVPPTPNQNINSVAPTVTTQPVAVQAQPSISNMTKPKGTIKPTSTGQITPQPTLMGKLSSAMKAIPGAGGVIGALLPAEPVGVNIPGVGHMVTGYRKRRHKGLTYNEIKGAVKLLKLVKKFAPAGHHTALKVRKRK